MIGIIKGGCGILMYGYSGHGKSATTNSLRGCIEKIFKIDSRLLTNPAPVRRGNSQGHTTFNYRSYMLRSENGFIVIFDPWGIQTGNDNDERNIIGFNDMMAGRISVDQHREENKTEKEEGDRKVQIVVFVIDATTLSSDSNILSNIKKYYDSAVLEGRTCFVALTKMDLWIENNMSTNFLDIKKKDTGHFNANLIRNIEYIKMVNKIQYGINKDLEGRVFPIINNQPDEDYILPLNHFFIERFFYGLMKFHPQQLQLQQEQQLHSLRKSSFSSTIPHQNLYFASEKMFVEMSYDENVFQNVVEEKNNVMPRRVVSKNEHHNFFPPLLSCNLKLGNDHYRFSIIQKFIDPKLLSLQVIGCQNGGVIFKDNVYDPEDVIISTIENSISKKYISRKFRFVVKETKNNFELEHHEKVNREVNFLYLCFGNALTFYLERSDEFQPYDCALERTTRMSLELRWEMQQMKDEILKKIKELNKQREDIEEETKKELIEQNDRIRGCNNKIQQNQEEIKKNKKEENPWVWVISLSVSLILTFLGMSIILLVFLETTKKVLILLFGVLFVNLVGIGLVWGCYNQEDVEKRKMN